MPRPDPAHSRYDRQPTIPVPGHAAHAGADAVCRALATAAAERAVPILVIDTYPGTDLDALVTAATTGLPDYTLINVEDAALAPDILTARLERFLTPDRVFGVMAPHDLLEFYDATHLAALRTRIARATGPTLVYGWGAALAAPAAAVVVVADLARWEIQQRQRRGQPNWHADNADDDALRKYKRGYFIEWRVADRHKQRVFPHMDFYLDVNDPAQPVLIDRAAFDASLRVTVERPFRLVPFFDPGVWGGQWMKAVCGLDPTPPNYAWAFDGVPEENSLRYAYGSVTLEMPAMNVTLQRPLELLGPRTYARFGAEFPIRFDFLDTMQGGNLSLQVHPMTSYIQQQFGVAYTQNESYYLLDAAEGAVVYLGLQEGTDPDRMLADLDAAQTTGQFDALQYVNAIPARPHDHFPIPAGTVHCSGAGAMVLEISATPYIFTFKLWDWGRVGLDGLPRPIHLEHGRANIQWNRDTAWVQRHLLGLTEEVARGDGWVEERTGLDDLQFIETRRHWTSALVAHHTANTVNVLNLVAGTAAIVESPTGRFEPFTVHYAETFIVPAAVGAYTIRPAVAGERVATLKAFVRGSAEA
ncbi:MULTISPECIES: class I mannose-6-phosphate isomerase [Deinococcus]|uniref:Class I mannose-6-phosphate isomerase n=1 Tax=Deinococcus rufus TaxID=2136097 RepID=A0ABV7ZC24_9DEIO|nr:class I mannose-6-phosphate isomerase [Deinococcus sp. AB2017081]WQE97316.1 class I mannose-6-phosphate isomerase [Deinococcus sp. AB2017081]